MSVRAIVLLALASPLVIPRSAAVQESSIDLRVAAQAFEGARRLAAADDGELWGISLDFPLLFIDPKSRNCVANRAGQQGLLAQAGELWTGQFPAELPIANATTQWAGTRWTMLVWPVPENELGRARLLMHESFHNAQRPLKITGGGGGPCDHLATHDGRLWLRLEAEALAVALSSEGDRREEAAADALLFRAMRRALFPSAEVAEEAVERLEGSAEYTGVRLSTESPDEHVRATVELLRGLEKRASLTRSFMYATGPALGLLLDEYDPFWRESFLGGAGFTEMLAPAVWFEPIEDPSELEARASERAKEYDFERIAAEEAQRERERLERMAEYRRRYLEGPVLMLPARSLQRSFDPSRIEPLEGVGRVYGTLWLSDDWGVANAPGGGLILDEGGVYLAAPRDLEGDELGGVGWTLQLAAGWRVVPGVREGCYRLEPGDAPR